MPFIYAFQDAYLNSTYLIFPQGKNPQTIVNLSVCMLLLILQKSRFYLQFSLRKHIKIKITCLPLSCTVALLTSLLLLQQHKYSPRKIFCAPASVKKLWALDERLKTAWYQIHCVTQQKFIIKIIIFEIRVFHFYRKKLT